MDTHHAPWRTNKEIFNGDISPQIHDKSRLSPLKVYGNSVRFVLSTCDIKFLKKNFETLIAYEQSNSRICFIAAVYAEKGFENELQSTLDEICRKNNLRKVIFLVFTSAKLNQVLQNKTDQESIWDYKINFIRNARYNLLADIWEFLDLYNLEHSLLESSAYVVDFDNYFLDDLNHIIKKKYGLKKLIISWNSLQSPNKAYPQTLSGFSPQSGTNHSYKIIKAGFSAFSPNKLTRLFLKLYRGYTIGDSVSLIFLRLFTFYFSDQVGILLALLDIRASFPEDYAQEIGWIDIATSNIINLKKENAQYMWYPKGKTLKPD